MAADRPIAVVWKTADQITSRTSWLAVTWNSWTLEGGMVQNSTTGIEIPEHGLYEVYFHKAHGDWTGGNDTESCSKLYVISSIGGNRYVEVSNACGGTYGNVRDYDSRSNGFYVHLYKGDIIRMYHRWFGGTIAPLSLTGTGEDITTMSVRKVGTLADIEQASGSATGQASVSGSGRVRCISDGSATGQAVTAGSPRVLISASGSTQGEATVSGNPSLTLFASGSAQGEATVAGSAIVNVRASGSAQGEGSLDGTPRLVFRCLGQTGIVITAEAGSLLLIDAKYPGNHRQFFEQSDLLHPAGTREIVLIGDDTAPLLNRLEVVGYYNLDRDAGYTGTPYGFEGPAQTSPVLLGLKPGDKIQLEQADGEPVGANDGVTLTVVTPSTLEVFERLVFPDSPAGVKYKFRAIRRV